jgi:hypothetical protein
MAKVPVPAVPAAAYNPDRPASDLVKTAIKQLQTAILAAVDTEGEAARCIEVLTALLHEVRPHLIPTRYGPPKRPKRRARSSRKAASRRAKGARAARGRRRRR